MMYRIVNVTSMNVVIEDIGLRLQPVGGTSSQAIVRADVADKSVDLKRHARWIKIEKFEIASSRCAIPTVQAPVPEVMSLPAAPVQTPAPPPVSAKRDVEFENLLRSMDAMKSRQEDLFALLQAAMAKPAFAPSPAPFHVVQPSVAQSQDPVILPGKMLPESVEISVKPCETDLSRDDFDSALEALRKAKGR